MALHLHRGVDTAALAAGLAGMLAEPLPDPLVQEFVVVPAKGIERWLTQQLSHRLGTTGTTAFGADGVCAGVRFVSPASLVALLTGRRSTFSGRGADDPWSLDRLTWAVLDVLDTHLDEPWLRTVARHLGRGKEGLEAELRLGRRYAVARHLAGLLADYALQRPELLAAWRRGELTGTEGDLDWQAPLWRHVVERITEAPATSDDAVGPALGGDLDPVTPPDVRHAAVVAALREGSVELDLPPRLSMFGHTRLASTEIDLLAALATHRDVHLWLPQASPVAWDRLTDVVADGPIRRADDASVRHVRHPLLASLGRDARELQRSLVGCGAIDHGPVESADPVDPRGRDRRGDTLLAWLQEDLADDHPADAARRRARVIDPRDDSIGIHACHGPARQVEVLRDVLTGLLEDDPTLEPRDILVMVPDIEEYAPLFAAAFGLGDEAGEFAHPAHGFRVRLADRSLVATNPLFHVTLALLDLAAGRVTVSQMLDLATHPAVARRFRFDDDAVEKIEAWIEQAGIRWGLDAAHRETYRLAAFDQNTWRAGLDRLLLGVAMADGVTTHGDAGDTGFGDRNHLGPVLPVDDVGSGDIDLVGRFTEFTDRVAAVLDAVRAADGVHEWMAALRGGVAALTSVATADEWQQAQLDRELVSVADSARTDTHMRLADVRRLLERRLGGRPTRANFRTGTLTVCTMVPMRSVPHRVVALVGLDDGAFPRAETLDGDDVLLRDPRTGERDRRSEDRQLLLDALMAAREHLVLTYGGASDVDGSTRPPAVPVGELLDTISGLADDVTRDDGTPRVLHAHPLQPFDPALLDADAPFTFDRAAFEGALALAAHRTPRDPFLTGPLPTGPDAGGDVALDDLQAFFANPARAFLRERLDVQPLRDEESDLDAIPVELDGLGTWGVGDRILHDALAGVHPDNAVRAEASRGLVPPAKLGERAVTGVVGVVHALMAAAAPVRVGEARAVDLTAVLPGGRRLTGTVTGVHGTDVLTVSYSALSAKSRIRAWIDLLALTVAHPEGPWVAHVVARQRGGAVHRVWGPLPPTAAAQWLADLVDVRDRGLCEPIPLPPKASLAYAEAASRRRDVEADDPHAGRDTTAPVDAARRAWETDRKRGAFPGEHADPSFARIHSDGAPLEVLFAGSGPDETWNDEPTRFGRYAVRVWQPEITNGRRV
ncbi:exodeoxyribonuclease V subunit gamma [Mobilicoccus pelagius]|uniref:RecBCD enzyme subunit RecC n=1 Tax=Mobilicoccus pelagius NBRC 104925 TaxID=1089455 RepID=H5UMH4_9MICO|nr:exodeoxyribonuclease V subunit gamma [Mobilicoccus pelagius]GAB46932.1 exodeoxyribonuclease V gamma chain [Mobilicoccus pelagius NBRC 104925]